MAKTRIVVIQLKEIIYTVIFAALGILLILLLVFMFSGKDKEEDVAGDNKLYKAGVWTTTIPLSDTVLNLEVILDEDHIKSVRIVNIDETITTMYPLVAPAVEEISEQLSNGVPIDELKLNDDSKYTQTLLIDAIKVVLEKAKATP